VSPSHPIVGQPSEVKRLDPYVFMAVIGKRVIHPGGRAWTERLLRRGWCRSSLATPRAAQRQNFQPSE
jgi:hypothetical protein